MLYLKELKANIEMNQKYIINVTYIERIQILEVTHNKMISKTIQNSANTLLI